MIRVTFGWLRAISFLSLGTLTWPACILQAAAGVGPPPIPCSERPGVIQEVSMNPATFTVSITDADGNVRVPQPKGFPASHAGVRGDDGRYRWVFDIPATIGLSCDALNSTMLSKKDAPPPGDIPSEGGEVADLYLEAIVFDATTGAYSLEDFFGRLAADVGVGVEIPIPDLYADTNGDGVLDSGDVLYSLDDINKYLAAAPTFALGDTFSVNDGAVAGLPGMMFSTTPFSFDPSTGFSPGTPYTGLAEAETEHLPAAVAEPDKWVLMSIALGGLLIVRQRRSAAPVFG
jgi:hypothetical protein